MGIFKELLNDLKSRDPETLDLLNTISAQVDEREKEEFDSSLLSDVEFVVKEELIFGYLVLYQYRKKAICERDKQGNNIERTISELMIISIIEPLSQKIIPNDDTKAVVRSKIIQNEDL